MYFLKIKVKVKIKKHSLKFGFGREKKVSVQEKDFMKSAPKKNEAYS